MKKLKGWFLLLTAPLFSLQEKPWFGNLYEIEATACYAYSSFDKVNRGTPFLKHTWRDHLFSLGLAARIPENWNFEIELQGDATSRRSFGYSSTAFQGRYLWLDDVAGDPISLVMGATLRQTSVKSLHQLSTPYHARFDAEFHTALGKEWIRESCLLHRWFVFGAFGKGIRGASWWRADSCYSCKYSDRVEWRLFLLWYFGCGHKQRVHLKDFHGWSQMAHRSLDLGTGLRFILGLWGSLRFDYKYRLYAHSYPQRVNFFLFSYEIPFSLF